MVLAGVWCVFLVLVLCVVCYVSLMLRLSLWALSCWYWHALLLLCVKGCVVLLALLLLLLLCGVGGGAVVSYGWLLCVMVDSVGVVCCLVSVAWHWCML